MKVLPIASCAVALTVSLLGPANPAAHAQAQASAPAATQGASTSPPATGGVTPLVTDPAFGATGWDAADRAIAARFAPVFHQGMIGTRFDFITNFDFDGDWVGDNNWANAAETKFAQKAYVYYAVSETPTHYFIHYAAYHPRDYKGGELTGAVLSQAIRKGAEASQRVKQLPMANDIVLAHENDLEGCLVVVQKKGSRIDDAEVVIVETLAHNRYLKFVPGATLTGNVGTVRLVEGTHPEIFIEPKGHGMEAFADQLLKAKEGGGLSLPIPGLGGITGTSGGANGAGNGLVGRLTTLAARVDTARRLVNLEQPETIRQYRYTGSAEDPERGSAAESTVSTAKAARAGLVTGVPGATGSADAASAAGAGNVAGAVGYDLLPVYHTMWARARRVPNETYGEAQDYGNREVKVAGATPSTKSITLGSLGSAFRGVQGAENKARPPWGWFDMSERDRPLGEWFFDPAAVVLRHFPSSGIDPAYMHEPFLGVTRK